MMDRRLKAPAVWDGNVDGLKQICNREEWARYLRTRSIEDRNRLVELNYGLLCSRCLKYFHDNGKPYWTTVEELESFAAPKLLRAVELFDPAQGVQFSTYATRAIDRKLWRALNEQLELPAYIKAQQRSTLGRRIPLSLLQDKGRNPAAKDKPREVGDNWVAGLRKFLPERDHQVLMLRYKAGLTLEECGVRLGVTKERIRQLETRAIRRLQRESEASLLLEDTPSQNGLRISDFPDERRPAITAFTAFTTPRDTTPERTVTVDNINPLEFLEQISLEDVQKKIAELEKEIVGWKAIYNIVAARSGAPPLPEPSRKTRTPCAPGEKPASKNSELATSVIALLGEHGALHQSAIADLLHISRLGMRLRLKAIAGITQNADGLWTLVDASP